MENILTDNYFRFSLFRSRLSNLFATSYENQEEFILADLVQQINEGLPTSSLFGTDEAIAACTVMSTRNELMLSDGVVYKI